MNLKMKTIFTVNSQRKKFVTNYQTNFINMNLNCTRFLLHIRRPFRQTVFIIVIVFLSEVRIVNEALNIPF